MLLSYINICLVILHLIYM